jgi:hypothetical protein
MNVSSVTIVGVTLSENRTCPPGSGGSGVTDHMHRELNREVTSIAGSYVLVKEERLPLAGVRCLSWSATPPLTPLAVG